MISNYLQIAYTSVHDTETNFDDKLDSQYLYVFFVNMPIFTICKIL